MKWTTRDKNEDPEAQNRRGEDVQKTKRKRKRELQKLKMMSPDISRATVVRGYMNWMVQVPWNARSKVKKDLRQAQGIADTDHYRLST
ncbi:hypothetical protein ACLK19_03010 [Escherichia coli]